MDATQEDASRESHPSTRDDALDAELIGRAARGDGSAFHALVDRHSDRLFRLAVTLVGNSTDAEDVLQETFSGAYRGMKRFRGESSVATWLTRVLAIQSANWRRERARRRRKASELSEAQDVASGASDASRSVAAKMDLQAALATLSPEHREVLVLREMGQLSYEELAATLKLPRGTIESRLHRARAELQKRLEAYRP